MLPTSSSSSSSGVSSTGMQCIPHDVSIERYTQGYHILTCSKNRRARSTHSSYQRKFPITSGTQSIVCTVDPYVSHHTHSVPPGSHLSTLMSCDSSLSSCTGRREPSNRLLHVPARSVISRLPFCSLVVVALSISSTLQTLYTLLLGRCAAVVLGSAIADQRSKSGTSSTPVDTPVPHSNTSRSCWIAFPCLHLLLLST